MIFSLGAFARLARAVWVMARAGVFADVDPSYVPAKARLPLSLAKMIGGGKRKPGAGIQALPDAISRLGPSYVKMGQFLATRPDVVGPTVVLQLERLQDRMEPFGRDVAVSQIERAFGVKIDTLFVEFGEPVAAASIAQVHKARVRDNSGERHVAVKVRRPGVERQLNRDLNDIKIAVRWLERHFPDTRRLKPVAVIETLSRALRMETDFRLEAAAASEFAENVAREVDFRIPAIDWDRTAAEVLTLEWIDGTRLTDTAELLRRGYNLPKLGAVVIQTFLRHAMRDGFFHADMHQGNLFIDRDARLVAVDFGIMGRLGRQERRFLAEILYGFIMRDYVRVAEVHFEAGYVPRHHRVADFAQAIRAIGEPIHSRKADEISMARLLTLLFEITALFDMKARVELVLLQKTMVVVEGVARGLDPRLDMWTTAEPVVRSWIEENLGPVGRIQDAGHAVAQMTRFAFSLPETMTRAERTLEKLEDMIDNGVGFSDDALKQFGDIEKRAQRLGHYALWVLAGLAAFYFLR